MLVTYGTIKMLYHGGFSFWPLQSNIENLKTCLNNMHPSIKFTFENPEIIYQNDKKVQVLNSLDVKKKKPYMKTTQLKLIFTTNKGTPTTTYQTILHTLIITKTISPKT